MLGSGGRMPQSRKQQVRGGLKRAGGGAGDLKILHRVPYHRHKEHKYSFFWETKQISEYLEACPWLI